MAAGHGCTTITTTLGDLNKEPDAETLLHEAEDPPIPPAGAEERVQLQRDGGNNTNQRPHDHVLRARHGVLRGYALREDSDDPRGRGPVPMHSVRAGGYGRAYDQPDARYGVSGARSVTSMGCDDSDGQRRDDGAAPLRARFQAPRQSYGRGQDRYSGGGNSDSVVHQGPVLELPEILTTDEDDVMDPEMVTCYCPRCGRPHDAWSREVYARHY